MYARCFYCSQPHASYKDYHIWAISTSKTNVTWCNRYNRIQTSFYEKCVDIWTCNLIPPWLSQNSPIPNIIADVNICCMIPDMTESRLVKARECLICSELFPSGSLQFYLFARKMQVKLSVMETQLDAIICNYSVYCNSQVRKLPSCCNYNVSHMSRQRCQHRWWWQNIKHDLIGFHKNRWFVLLQKRPL